MNYIESAYEESLLAYQEDEVPVGCVIVYKDKIIAKSHNKKVQSNNVFDHAEILCIKEANKYFNDWRLNDCTMYVTLEPCPMCASAIEQSRIKKVYIGTKSNLKSNKDIMESIFNNKEFYHTVEYEYLDDIKSKEILTKFFKEKRNK